MIFRYSLQLFVAKAWKNYHIPCYSETWAIFRLQSCEAHLFQYDQWIKLSSSVVPLWSAWFSGDVCIQHVTLWSVTAASLYWEATIRLENSKHLTATSRESALCTPRHHTQSDTMKLVLMVPRFSSHGRTSVAFRYSPRFICRVLQWRKETMGAIGLYWEMSFFAWTIPAENSRSQTHCTVARNGGAPGKKKDSFMYNVTKTQQTLMWIFFVHLPTWGGMFQISKTAWFFWKEVFTLLCYRFIALITQLLNWAQ